MDKSDLILSRITSLESKMDKNIKKMQDHEQYHAKQKGFIGGIVFTVSAVWAIGTWVFIHLFQLNINVPKH